MSVKRRKVLKSLGAVTSGIAASTVALSGTAEAWTQIHVENECSAAYVLTDGNPEGTLNIYPDMDSCDDHKIDLVASADVVEDHACAEGERITAEAYQKRENCNDGSTYFEKIASATAECKDYNDGCSDNDAAYKCVSTKGDGWAATGTYKLTVIPCFYWEGGPYEPTCHTWADGEWHCTENEECGKESSFGTESQDTGSCC